MKVLGIVGGPNPAGNTGLLVKAVLEGAQSSGHVTTLFNLAELDIGHLTSKDEKITYPKDDMEKLYPHIESMGALVIGSPIYYEAWDSRAITFLNRLYIYGEVRKVRFPKGAKVVNCITYGWDKIGAYDKIHDWAEEMEKYLGLKPVGRLSAEGTGSKPVSRRNDLLEEARNIGSNL